MKRKRMKKEKRKRMKKEKRKKIKKGKKLVFIVFFIFL
jgi:hypothetical protein